MVETGLSSWWRRFAALPKENPLKTIAIAFLVSSLCAVLVTASSVLLSPLIAANVAAERAQRFDAMLANMPGLADIVGQSGADSLTAVVVDLRTGQPTNIDPQGFDMREVAADPARSSPIPPAADIAGLKTRANFSAIYILRDAGKLRLVILPIVAVGYQSTIYANLALEGDLNTVAGLSIVEQGETPGLGARIAEPSWQALWPGKKLEDANGEIVLRVVQGTAQNVYEVDGITGATRTGQAVTAAVQFWVGPYGYGPVLENLAAGTFGS